MIRQPRDELSGGVGCTTVLWYGLGLNDGMGMAHGSLK